VTIQSISESTEYVLKGALGEEVSNPQGFGHKPVGSRHSGKGAGYSELILKHSRQPLGDTD
jgi:hypothetical protein